uniref:Uncharacterized protein n=1 Tax=uncultured Desulfobacterium sp. TaxID=201089 RepID=E1YFL6_9BACT|nr:unknown protein [uncultured Desulfobacterium sp.]
MPRKEKITAISKLPYMANTLFNSFDPYFLLTSHVIIRRMKISVTLCMILIS